MIPLYISIPIIVVGILLQLVRLFFDKYKEHIEKIPHLRRIIFILSLLLIIFGGSQVIYSTFQTKKHEVYASPAELRIKPRINKEFILNVSNNKDISIYDVNFSMCFDNQSIDHSIINIEPISKDLVSNVPISMMRVNLSNGCSSIVLDSISPHSTREFHVRLNGEKISFDYRVSFIVYDWEVEPSLIDISTTKEQFNSPPQNFQGYFDNNNSKSEKTGKAFFRNWKAPFNPYFPDQKKSQMISIGFYQQ